MCGWVKISGREILTIMKKNQPMKNIFISFPMRGKSREEIEAERSRLLKLASEYLGEPVVLISSYLNENVKPLVCLGENLKRMAEADYVLFRDGFETAERGAPECRIEHLCARGYDKKILLEINNQIQEEF